MATRLSVAATHDPQQACRWAVQLEYDGTPFIGWQRQASGRSVQDVLEAAAARLTGGRPVASIVAGRTDAGVHAAGQVAHLDLPLAVSERLTGARLCDALNFHMKPDPVAVLRAARVGPEFSARFSAIRRSYEYRILNRPARPALDANRAWHVRQHLDIARMQAAAALLVGRHDFSSFRAASCQARSPVRTLDRLDVTRAGESVMLRAEARSFLHHQIRNLAGTLKLVGDHRWNLEDVAAALAARDRSQAGPTAPPQGLCLLAVAYPIDPFA
ncbi:tRNA pseudouridine(38-40) synthase TruA [Lichenicoccus sp.]|uniref:tRNA pseudouridine(38-40) synthase TruA n=1 Tax=Lichenicoccus sp. TaxID=2781899 RepID=UPI003D0DB982